MELQQLIQDLHRKRGHVKHRLTSFHKFYESIQKSIAENDGQVSNEMFDVVQARIKTSHDILLAFNIEQQKIEEVCQEDSLEMEYAERDRFESVYYSVVSKLNRIITDSNLNLIGNPSLNHDLSPTRSDVLNSVKLPIINLPKFSGTVTEWLEFKETFESLIHTNDRITKVQKFHYLKASLTGCAAKSILKPNLSCSNYDAVWDMLCNRYSNRDLLIHEHLKAIFELQPTSSGESTGYRNMSDELNRHLKYISQLGDFAQQRDALLIYILTAKLDKVSLREWEEFLRQNNGSTLNNFERFIINKAEVFEKLEQRSIKVKQTSHIKSHQHGFISTEIKCILCKSNHALYHCSEFLKLTPQQRFDKVKLLKLCTNCLKVGHINSICTSGHCRVCKKNHNTLLHFEQQMSEKPIQAQSIMTSQITKCNSQVLLSTICLTVIGSQGKDYKCRALLDNGSQSHFMTYSFLKRIRLPKYNSKISIVGIGNLSSNIQHQCHVTIKSNHTNFHKTINCFLLPTISDNMPGHKINSNAFNFPNVQLADPTFNEPGQIDMLIGAELFWNILKPNKLNLGKGNPLLQETEFGWVVSGTYNPPTYSNSHCNLSKLKNIQDQLQMFWDTEECHESENVLSINDQECELHFLETFSRNVNGRFVVGIPFKDSPKKLGQSKHIALRRFYNLERKLQQNSELKNQYSQFISEYQKLGHMTKLSKPVDDTLSYYFPHHAVFKLDSLTTKVRVVFDGSAATDNGISLNDLQHVGPVIQEDIIAILIRFRQHAYVFTADVAKMYRQIELAPNDRKFHRILWRSDPKKEIDVFELNTVTYGTSSAPFLATRCLKQLAIENKVTYPLASQVIARDFYVDDLISGANTLEEAQSLCKEVSNILSSGCFELRKWCSNDYRVLDTIKDSDHLSHLINIGEISETKLLGLQWSFIADSFTYHINNKVKSDRVTKRSILSEIARTFDPLGLLSPSIIIVKIILQDLWSLKSGWDDEVPENVKFKWNNFQSNLHYFNSLKIPRFVLSRNANNIELHGFCDASQDAYGACVYARSIDEQNKINVKLFCAKSKVAPLQVLSIPRLELCSAIVLARLMYKIKSSVTFPVQCFYWSDSQVVLSWIKSQSKQFQIFVANRIAEIQRLTVIENWRHVSTNSNPADLISRGVQPNNLVNSDLWWDGPFWLSQHKEIWPVSSTITILENDIPEKRKLFQSCLVTNDEGFLFKRFSSLTKLKRVTAYCLRFVHNCMLQNKERRFGSLSVTELNDSFQTLIKISQKIHLSDEINFLQTNKQTLQNHKLRCLNPFLDSRGVLRVGGRIQNAKLSYDQIHPILLSAKCHLCKLIFNYEHLRLYHAGPQLLLFTVRQQFWVIGARNLARKTVHNCINCFRVSPKSNIPLMGNLPSQRIQPTYPFMVSGTDFAGPFWIRERSGRGQRRFKCYICLFVCMTTKAVHLEVVTDLTSNSFIALLRRFIARRGQPSDICSDNGKTYVGAESELRDVGNFIRNNSNQISEQAACKGIKWHFIPAYSPNFGGLWEAGIKSMKHHLKRVLMNASVTLEGMITIVTQIEGILNSRPISPMSNDPRDFLPLSPAHFLIGRPITSIMEPDIRHIKSRLSTYQQMEQIRQHFWSRWYKEYITELQFRRKWNKHTTNIENNTLVLLKDDNLPPLRWKIGRIVKLHPGHDGIVRVVSIETPTSIVKRATSQVCPLPMETETD